MYTDSQRVVVVLGAGRSGTSLLMQILVGLGSRVSNNLIPANVSNPEGFYENADIKDILTDLYTCLNVPVSLPLPKGWLETNCAKKAKQRLNPILQGLLEDRSATLAIKDPRIATFLPLWVRLFNPLRVVPCYLLAVREPRSVIASFIRQYNNPGHLAELIWLLRTLEALENTAADCFVVHYEDWFGEPMPLAQALLHYTKLDQNFKGNLSEALANTVKANLNRASKDDYKIKNLYVLKLYAALQECHGANFDRDRLMAVVRECRESMKGFESWYQLAQEANIQLADIKVRLEKANYEATKVKMLEERIQALEKKKAQSQLLVVQVQRLQRQLDQLMTLDAV